MARKSAEPVPAVRPQGTITSFFNRTARAKVERVDCPVCGESVQMDKINSHMDGGHCRAPPQQLVDQQKLKRRLQEEATGGNGCSPNSKKLKPDIIVIESTEDCDSAQALDKENDECRIVEESEQDLKDAALVAELVEDGDGWKEEEEDTPSQRVILSPGKKWQEEEEEETLTPSQRIILSPSISYNPAR